MASLFLVALASAAGDVPTFEVDWGTPEAPSLVQVGDRLQLRLKAFDVAQEVTGARPSPRPKPAPPGKKSTASPETFRPTLPETGWYILPDLQRTAQELSFTAVPLRSGRVFFPTMEWINGNGEVVAKSLAFAVKIVPTVDPRSEEAQQPPPELIPPQGFRFPASAAVVLVLAALLVVALLVYLLLRWSRGRRTVQKAAIPPQPPKPEDLVALTGLNRLEAKKLWKSKKYKPLYFGVSDILKHYIARRYEFDAIESTTLEMLRSLEKHGIKDRTIDELEGLFARLDRVKFTKLLPDNHEATTIINEARAWVLKTRAPRVPETVTPKVGNRAV